MHKITNDQDGLKLIFVPHCSEYYQLSSYPKNLLISLNTGEERVVFVFSGTQVHELREKSIQMTFTTI